ncbi:aceric acid hydrolase [Flavilitoribacter nigricans]|uniref:ATP-binding protein n=1 Tax=Flavilitoribacter nigricans (strain ATCC 23147 / DSM 23189 / NBRC 102662 / NCIMB 1420 / SS-2) TaxID=1122177 RepID=A0A2D0N1L1_FLAN2|nr:glycoside hydrolase family 127 protein [Flavilitoribacter nigricans]PHN02421.1 ATP-binding protein [Flavilitoribacter nigricans DSM 23189 = NBRC 102662]
MKQTTYSAILILFFCCLLSRPGTAQDRAITVTSASPYAKLSGVNLGDVHWTAGFWADRFEVCESSMVPHMLGNYMDEEISHAYTNFEIAAGLREGTHKGPSFHDGDFYKMLEGAIMILSVSKDPQLDREIDRIIEVIGKGQRKDGYIHTKALIKAINEPGKKHEFIERLDFETYNMGHLMTAACLHHRITGKSNLLDIAEKATDFLYNFYKRASAELARNAICPSHYMGVVEMYRTTKDPKYLELAENLIDIRSLVENGTDHNQDRIPFKQQTEAVGHAVRANYLYAGVADVYAETGDDSLFQALDLIWQDLVQRKMYITGACGALYDGVSPNGTTYKQNTIQQVHQAYGRPYELPNLTAHNESCANIGNLLWNWRMLQVTADAKYADLMERVMYNSLLAGVSLDGKGYFYTNPLCVNTDDLSSDLRWSKDREEYISYCNCCPPNTIRTIAQLQNYIYNLADDGLYVNLYGSNDLKTTLGDGRRIELSQDTDYPFGEDINIRIQEFPRGYGLYLRVPAWAKEAELSVNGQVVDSGLRGGQYVALENDLKKGDRVRLHLPLRAKLIESNPLVEGNRNQVAVQYGPVVYCLEGNDLPENCNLFDISIPRNIVLQPVQKTIGSAKLTALEGEFHWNKRSNWNNTLYREIDTESADKIKLQLIPYFAWDNRGLAEMSVWLPID